MEALDDLELGRRLTALTRDLILIQSTDAQPEERARCFEFIRIQLEGLEGVRLEEFEKGGYTSLVVLPEGVKRPEVLFCGHLDVVEHPDSSSYRSEVRDGRIYGPGAGDMKGALAIMLELFRQKHRREPGISLGLAITSDEECGGEQGVKYLVEEVGLRCGQVIIPDGGSLNELTLEEKGILHLRVRCHGHSAHAARPWLGENALSRLVGRLGELDRYFGGLKGADDAALRKRGEDHWFPTCSLTMLGTPNETVNRIPAEAEAVLDVRFPPPDTVETMLAKVRQILGDEVAVEEIVSAEPTHLAADKAFMRVTEEVTGTPVKEVQACGGSDARFFRAAGIPVNLSRPLVGELHSEDEWIDVASMVMYYRICEAYLGAKGLD
jgi:succinyl-diaminopimelate desuccinylase